MEAQFPYCPLSLYNWELSGEIMQFKETIHLCLEYRVIDSISNLRTFVQNHEYIVLIPYF